MRRISIVLAAVVLTSLAGVPASVGSTGHITAARSASAADDTEPTLLWQTPLPDLGDNRSVFLQGNSLYVMGTASLVALNTTNGNLRWSFEARAGLWDFVVMDEAIFLTGPSETYRLEAETGQIVWQYGGGGGLTLDEGRAIISDGQYVVAVDAASGDMAWSFDFGPGTFASSESAKDGVVYVGTTDGTVHAFNMATGNELWRSQELRHDDQDPLILSVKPGLDSVIAANDSGLYALDIRTGLERWRHRADLSWANDVTDLFGTVGNTTYLVSWARSEGASMPTISGLDSETGQVRWQYEHGFWFPVVSETTIYFQSATDDAWQLVAFDVESSQELWSRVFDSLETPLASRGGVLYAGTGSIENPELSALSTDSGEDLWSVSARVGWELDVGPNGVIYGLAAGNTAAAIGMGTPHECTNGEPLPIAFPYSEGGQAMVLEDAVPLRAAPSPEGALLEEIPRCTIVELISSESRDEVIWWRVTDPETGNTGYIEQASLVALPDNEN